ncbi:tetratricopeptide repeat protein [Solemya pervernicosa gill symbiont]|uniref:tetratricopeptide repeat protein n=1 Tax=Solemya pervernicosa gill symbiont TaxID=642797 RepID=UPI00099636E7|nr:tetratricopeptide repeat protein [Solemya pervernicosa gill symbiont]
MRHLLTLLISILLLTSCADLQVAQRANLECDYETAFDNWEVLARKDFPEAEYQLAKLYAAGHLGTDRQQEALTHYQRAIELGHTGALYGMGQFLLRYAKSDVERATAIDALKQAATAGSVPAEIVLAELYIEGQYLPRDTSRGVEILSRHANADNPRAQYKLALLYDEGIALQQNYAKAYDYYQRALALGHRSAANRLATLYIEGRGVAVDYDRARELLQQQIDLGNMSAAYRLAALEEQLSGESGPSARSVELYRQAASGGYEAARLRMADLYFHGIGVERDIDKAINTYQEMSIGGYGPATAKLGDLYRDGEEKPLDYAYAHELYQLSYDQGFERAELRMARMMGYGLGVTRDIRAARLIYHKYALRGDVSAAYGAAQMIELMADFDHFPLEAVSWYQRAGEAGHQGARLRLAGLYWEGLGVDLDKSRAVALLEALVEEQYTPAMVRLGDYYRDGNYLPRNHIKARDHYLAAVEGHDGNARLKLADLYAQGDEAVRDFEAARVIFVDLSKAGDHAATYKLARMLEFRLGDNAVTPEIVALYERSAVAGYPPAQLRYADLQLEGIGVEQNVDRAIASYRILSERGLGAATFRLGKLVEYGRFETLDIDKAVRLYRKSIDQGYDLGNLQMARLHAVGKGVPRDLRYARQIFERFAVTGTIKAAYELGELYSIHKTQLSTDWLALAIKWYERAAQLGYLDAKYALAELLDSQKGQDRRYVMRLYHEAALAGHGRAMSRYGERLFNGISAKRNQAEGLAFVLTAARSNSSGALKLALSLMDRINRAADIRRANLRSLELKSEIFKVTGVLSE